MRISVDADRCQGHGRCYELAPDLFGADDEGHATVLVPDVADGSGQGADLAVRSCPEGAISLDT